jgi:hypothetical protein
MLISTLLFIHQIGSCACSSWQDRVGFLKLISFHKCEVILIEHETEIDKEVAFHWPVRNAGSKWPMRFASCSKPISLSKQRMFICEYPLPIDNGNDAI